jgi:hypothetical protein
MKSMHYLHDYPKTQDHQVFSTEPPKRSRTIMIMRPNKDKLSQFNQAFIFWWFSNDNFEIFQTGKSPEDEHFSSSRS